MTCRYGTSILQTPLFKIINFVLNTNTFSYENQINRFWTSYTVLFTLTFSSLNTHKYAYMRSLINPCTCIYFIQCIQVLQVFNLFFFFIWSAKMTSALYQRGLFPSLLQHEKDEKNWKTYFYWQEMYWHYTVNWDWHLWPGMHTHVLFFFFSPQKQCVTFPPFFQNRSCCSFSQPSIIWEFWEGSSSERHVSTYRCTDLPFRNNTLQLLHFKLLSQLRILQIWRILLKTYWERNYADKEKTLPSSESSFNTGSIIQKLITDNCNVSGITQFQM